MAHAIRLVASIILWGAISIQAWAQNAEPAEQQAPAKGQAAQPVEHAGGPAESQVEVATPFPEIAEPLPEGPLPSISLEITEINGAPIPGGPRPEFNLSPADVFTAKIFIRDWSINGEKLRSFQATLDPATFTSGQSGKIEPVNYGWGANAENAFIDETDPMYVHRGLHTIPAVDTSGADYRWLSVLFNTDESPLSPMDGTKFSCGTVHMRVSEDASGTFTLKLKNDPSLTMLINPNNDLIPHLQLEPLVLHVASSGEWLRIRSSSPPGGAVAPHLLGQGESCRWDSIQLISSGDASSLRVEEFEVADGTTNPPRVQRIEVDPQSPGAATLHLSRGITPGRWTKVVHKPSQSSTTVGCLPGDVNGDAVLNGRDVTALIEVLNGQRRMDTAQTDLNADGILTSADLAGLLDLVASGPTGQRIAGRTD